MDADTNFISGGDGAIFTSFTKKDRINEADSTVNELIASCKTSKESLSRLYVMFKDTVFAVGFGITSDYHLAEDCVTETFVRLTQVKHFSAKKGDGKGFIITIARNVAFELRRRYKKEITNFIIQSYGEAEKTVEDSIYINQLLKHLNEKQRETVILKCCAELTFKQIAQVMKCPETTAKSRYKKAITILQEKAGEDQ
ncbi:Sigma-70 region 2 [Ruminococcus flavefaciens]|uniref:Sigma-70 region 2 n=1 Tax=Ruminococcus flavefaciens TaxID=1265 RepID=A0A1H6JK18_RUMFL|nr:sigma-70 family RNA polymerase sigma factor [Ruminococcus flavefaciens]SEH60091.1 Sigma-70 region 2 [Ruminococcus flavefaciens]